MPAGKKYLNHFFDLLRFSLILDSLVGQRQAQHPTKNS